MAVIELDVSGTKVHVEYTESSVPKKAGFKGNVTASFEEAQTTIIKLAQAFTESLQTIEKELAPDEAEISFGLKMSASADWVISKIDAEASFGIKLNWKLKP
jgi:hypothetical protein